MTDLVERLRTTRTADLDRTRLEFSLLREAADEIERLTAAVDACADYGDKQVAEIERLTAALEKYGDHKYECTLRLLRHAGGHGKAPMTDFTDAKVIYYLQSISRNLDELAGAFSDTSFVPSIGSEVLADNRDWLANYIDMLRKRAGDGSR